MIVIPVLGQRGCNALQPENHIRSARFDADKYLASRDPRLAEAGVCALSWGRLDYGVGFHSLHLATGGGFALIVCRHLPGIICLGLTIASGSDRLTDASSETTARLSVLFRNGDRLASYSY